MRTPEATPAPSSEAKIAFWADSPSRRRPVQAAYEPATAA